MRQEYVVNMWWYVATVSDENLNSEKQQIANKLVKKVLRARYFPQELVEAKTELKGERTLETQVQINSNLARRPLDV